MDFEDLIPAQNRRGGNNGNVSFDDLIPSQPSQSTTRQVAPPTQQSQQSQQRKEKLSFDFANDPDLKSLVYHAGEVSRQENEPETPYLEEQVRNFYDAKGIKNLDRASAENLFANLPPKIADQIRYLWAGDFASKKKKTNEQSTLGSIRQGVYDKAQQFLEYTPFGSYMDEAAAYPRAALGADLDTELAIQRMQKYNSYKGDENPLLKTPLGDIYGSGLTKVAGLASNVYFPSARVFSGATATGKGLNAAVTGGGYSAATAFGEGRNTEERTNNAINYGTLGAVIGGGASRVANSEVARSTLTGLGKAAKGIGSALGNMGTRATGLRVQKPATVAENKLVQALSDQGQTPAQAATRLEVMREGGKPVTIADLGTATQREARGAKVASKAVDAQAEGQLMQRAKGQMERIDTDVRRAMQIGDRQFKGDLDRVISERRKQSGPLYRRAEKNKELIEVSDIVQELKVIASQEVGKAKANLNKVVKLFYKGNKNKKDLSNLRSVSKSYIDLTKDSDTVLRETTRELHRVKMAIDDILDRSPANPNSVEKRVKGMLAEFKNKLLDRIDEVNPQYKQARQIFSSASSMKSALENGRRFLKGDAEFLADDIAKMTSSEREMFRVGVVRELKNIMGRKSLGHDLTSNFTKPNTVDALRATFPDEKSFVKFYENIADEAVMTMTKNKVLTGSQSVEKAADLVDLGMFRRFISNMRNGNVIGGVVSTVSDFAEKSLKMSKHDADAIGRLLLEQDPNAQRQILRGLEMKYGAGRVRRARRRIGRQTMRAFAKEFYNKGSVTTGTLVGSGARKDETE